MPKSRPNRSKKPPIETSSDKSSFTFSFFTPDWFKIGEKRGHSQSPKNKNQKPIKKIIKLITITDSIPSILFPPLSPE